MRIREECSCGAAFEVEGVDVVTNPLIKNRYDSWLMHHSNCIIRTTHGATKKKQNENKDNQS